MATSVGPDRTGPDDQPQVPAPENSTVRTIRLLLIDDLIQSAGGVTALAAATGLTDRRIRDWRNGNRKPDIDVLFSLAVQYRVSFDRYVKLLAALGDAA